jgi:nucleotide-binding universal stress UspA family protein
MYAETMASVETTLDPHLMEEEKAYVARIAKQSNARGHLLEGPVAEAVVEFVAGNGIDLVVMTTHGRGAFSRFWLGSVTDELMRRLPIPLLLVRPGEGEEEFNQAPTLRHFLIPLDGTALAEQILAPATELGRLMEADYTLLRVVPPVPAVGFEPAGLSVGGFTPPAEDNLAVEAQAYLDRVAGRLRKEGLSVHTATAVGQPPGLAILAEARDRAMDVIAMETHGRKGLARLMLGSVADKVIRGSPLPVLVHRPLIK